MKKDKSASYAKMEHSIIRNSIDISVPNITLNTQKVQQLHQFTLLEKFTGSFCGKYGLSFATPPKRLYFDDQLAVDQKLSL